MADLDAELLALAGGDSDGEESIASPPRKSSSPLASEKEQTPPPTRKTANKNANRSRRRKNYSGDEEEDVSVSPRSESASMSQSESEAEFEETGDKPLYPYERLYYSAKDKAEIDAKPEIEREAILAERTEDLEKAEQNAQLRRMLQARAKEDAKHSAKRKRKASAADLDDKEARKSSRQRTLKSSEANSAIAAYKKQREEKALRDEQRRNRTTDRQQDSLLDEYSDVDADAESDDDFDDRDRRYNRDRDRRRRTPTPSKDDPIAELADIQRVRVGRENFAQVCYTPGFDETITGCYVRVCLGPGRLSGQNEYRLCSIKGFQRGRPYAIEGPNRKFFLVDKYIIAAHGKATRNWSFLECSNSRFTDDEWRRYKVTMANDDCRMPSRGQVNTKLAQINKLINHRFTDADISGKLRAQNALLDMVNRTAERKDLKEKIRDAEDHGDDEAVAELEEKLMNLVPMKLAMNTSLNLATAPSGTSGPPIKISAEADKLADLNRRNQKQTTENIQKAAIQKRRMKKIAEANRLAVPAGSQPQASQKSLDEDLFGSGVSDISRTGTPVNGLGTPRAVTPLRNGERKEEKEKKGLPVIKKSKRDDEVLQGIDLGIDIEI